MNSTTIKIIACLVMLIDHIGVVLLPGNMLLRIIGRIAMPLFAWQIAQGLRHTSSKAAYMKRLFIFGIISQFAYTFGLRIMHLNILFTFLLAALSTDLLDRAWKTGKLQYKVIVGIVYTSIFLLMDGSLMDYGRLVLYLVTCFYFFEGKKAIIITMAAASIFYFFLNCNIQQFMVLALPILLKYNGGWGGLKLPRYFFYWFYPAHMTVLGIIGMVIK